MDQKGTTWKWIFKWVKNGYFQIQRWKIQAVRAEKVDYKKYGVICLVLSNLGCFMQARMAYTREGLCKAWSFCGLKVFLLEMFLDFNQKCTNNIDKNNTSFQMKNLTRRTEHHMLRNQDHLSRLYDRKFSRKSLPQARVWHIQLRQFFLGF